MARVIPALRPGGNLQSRKAERRQPKTNTGGQTCRRTKTRVKTEDGGLRNYKEGDGLKKDEMVIFGNPKTLGGDVASRFSYAVPALVSCDTMSAPE